jgi:pimeloyl-ACP methyl ester carboxylesterase
MRKLIIFIACCMCSCSSFTGQQQKFLSKKELSKHNVGDIILQPTECKGHKAESGILIAKENWFAEKSNYLQIKLLRVFSDNEQKKEPLFYFTGGPGVSNINENWIDGWMLEDHDVILVGYRGLDSDYTIRSITLNSLFISDKNLISEKGMQNIAAAIDKEIIKRTRKGRDMAGYSVLNMVEDIETIRKSLGYKKIDITGLSFGGALAELYSFRYGENINKQILISPALFYNIAYSSPVKDTADIVWEGGLSNINKEWKKDSLCLIKSADIEKTVENVLKTLPKKYANIHLSANRIAYATQVMLYDQSTVAQCLDAYIAAEKGDYSGLAYMEFMLKTIPTFMNIFDLCYKTYSSHTESFKYEKPEKAVYSNSELAWGSYSYMKSEIPCIPDSLVKRKSIDVKSLIVIGETDGGEPWARIHSALYNNPDIVVLDNMGHQDMFTVQREGYTRMAKTYLLEGIVDTSLYKPVELQKINFIPTMTFQEIGRNYKRNILMRMKYSLMFLKMRLF